MKHGFMLLTMACAVATAFAAAQVDEKRPKPAASLSPPEEFSISPSTSTPPSPTAHTTDSATTTPPPKPTTPKNSSTTTTPPKPTTPKNSSTTTSPPTPTTPKNSSTTTTPPTPTTPKNSSTTTTPPTPTTPKNSSTTTSPPTPTTPKNSSTTTSTPPKPTTQNTNSTTHSATTTIPKTSNTTAAPTTHNATNQTTAAPPTPPQPTPKADLTVGEYILKKGKNVCAMVSMALQIRVEYNTKTKSEGTFIVQPNISSVDGTCNDSSIIFNIIFKEGFIDLQFLKNTTEVYVSSIAVELTYPFNHEDPEAKYSASNNSVQLFRAAIGHSYSCKSQSLYLGQGLHLDITQGRMQAFNITNGFGLPDACPADQPDYRVAIAVGIVLLILIVIVVVAYLIGRRRRTDGYQSL